MGISLSKGNPHKSILLGVAGNVCGLRLVTDTRGKGKDGPEKASCPPHVLDVFFLHVTKACSQIQVRTQKYYVSANSAGALASPSICSS